MRSAVGEGAKLANGHRDVNTRHVGRPHELAHELEVRNAVDGTAVGGREERVEAVARGFVRAVGRVLKRELVLVLLGELLDVSRLRNGERALAPIARDLDAGELEHGREVGGADVNERRVSALDGQVFVGALGGVADEDIVSEDADANAKRGVEIEIRLVEPRREAKLQPRGLIVGEPQVGALLDAFESFV